MASQYSLQLKAVLDSTQVKQELQKLRQMQNQILGNNRGNSINGSTSNSNNLGNINGLNSTLSRLTNSINQLNNAITKLNAFNQKTINTVQPQQNVTVAGRNNMPFTPVLGGVNSSKSFKILNEYGNYERDIQVDKFIQNKRFREQFHNKVMLANPAMGQAQAAIMGALPLYRAFESLPSGEYATLHSLANNNEFQKWYNKQNNQQSGFTPEMKRMLGGMAFGAGLNAISTGLEASGNTTGASIASGIGAVGSYALMGSAAGGVGAAIGAAVGLIQDGAEQIVAAFKEAADAAANMAKRIEQAKVVDQTKADIDMASADAKALRANDVDYFKKQKSKYSKKVNQDKYFQKWFLDLYGSLEAFEKETNRIEQEGYDGYFNNDNLLAEAERRKKLANRYTESVANLAKNQSRVDSYSSTIESLNNRSKGISESYRSFYSDRSFNDLLSGNDKGRIESYKKQLEEYLGGQKNLFEEYRADGFRNKNSEKVLSNIQLTEGRIDKLNSWISNFDAKQKAAEELALKTEQLNKQKAAEEEFNKKLSSLQNWLGSLQAPNMENVNSLASQGVMINRADDKSREQTMMDYSREQTDLQKKIKQILEEKSFESVIS